MNFPLQLKLNENMNNIQTWVIHLLKDNRFPMSSKNDKLVQLQIKISFWKKYKLVQSNKPWSAILTISAFRQLNTKFTVFFLILLYLGIQPLGKS